MKEMMVKCPKCGSSEMRMVQEGEDSIKCRFCSNEISLSEEKPAEKPKGMSAGYKQSPRKQVVKKPEPKKEEPKKEEPKKESKDDDDSGAKFSMNFDSKLGESKSKKKPLFSRKKKRSKKS